MIAMWTRCIYRIPDSHQMFLPNWSSGERDFVKETTREMPYDKLIWKHGMSSTVFPLIIWRYFLVFVTSDFVFRTSDLNLTCLKSNWIPYSNIQMNGIAFVFRFRLTPFSHLMRPISITWYLRHLKCWASGYSGCLAPAPCEYGTRWKKPVLAVCFLKMGECREVLGGGPAPPSEL